MTNDERRGRDHSGILLGLESGPGGTGGGGGGGGPVTLTEILSAVSGNPALFYGAIQVPVRNDITTLINNWASTPTNNFTVLINGLRTDLTALQAQIGAVNNSLTNHVSAYNARVTYVDNVLTKLNSDFTAIDGRVTKIINGVDTNIINLKTLKADISALDVRVTTVVNSVADIVSVEIPKITALQVDVSGLKVSVASLNGDVGTLSTNLANFITATNATLTTHATDITAIRNRVTALETSVLSMTNKFIKYDAFFDDPLTTLTTTTIKNTFANIAASLLAAQTRLDDADLKIAALTVRVAAIEAWKPTVDTELTKIAGIESDIDTLEISVQDLQNELTKNIPDTKVVRETTPDDNKKHDGTDWAPTEKFPISASAQYSSIFPVLLKRINFVHSLIGPTDGRITNLETSVANITTLILGVQQSIADINLAIGDLATIRTDIADNKTAIASLVGKTINLTNAGRLSVKFVDIDPALEATYNASMTGADYTGNDAVKTDSATDPLHIVNVLNAFYSRIDKLLVTVVNLDITTINATLTQIQNDLADAIVEYTKFNADTNTRIDDLTDSQVSATMLQDDVNTFAPGELYTGNLAYDETVDNTVLQHLETLHKRVFELKVFMESYKNNQVLDTKVEVTVDKDIFNIDPVSGAAISTTDPKFIDNGSNLKHTLESLKLYINEAMIKIQDEKNAHYLAISNAVVNPADPEYDVAMPNKVTVSGNQYITGFSHFAKNADFDKDVVIDGKLNASELWVGGKRVDAVRRLIPGTYFSASTPVSLTDGATDGVYIINMGKNVGGLTAIAFDTAGATPSTATAHRDLYVVESLDEITLFANYAVKISIPSIPAGSYMAMDVKVRGTAAAIELTDYISRIERSKTGGPFGFSYRTDGQFSLSNRGSAGANLAGTIANTATTVLSNYRFIDNIGMYTGVSTKAGVGAFTDLMQLGQETTGFFMDSANLTTAKIVFDSGRKGLVIFGGTTAAEQRTFFLNYGYRFTFEKANF